MLGLRTFPVRNGWPALKNKMKPHLLEKTEKKKKAWRLDRARGMCTRYKQTAQFIFRVGTPKQTEKPVAHACNPSYSGGRDQEDHRSKPARENSSQSPILKNPLPKRAGRVAQGVGPEFKPQYCKQEKNKRASMPPKPLWVLSQRAPPSFLSKDDHSALYCYRLVLPD
jgi:hypothetical protein